MWFTELAFICLIFHQINGDPNAKLSRVRRIVGGEPSNVPPEDDPVIFTRFKGRTAKVVGAREFPHYVFKGLRYAQAPIGNLRFVRPREILLQGNVNATSFGQPCVQAVPSQNRIVGSEDCLFLNVFTPTLPTGSEGLPVVVWIHGGGFRYGSASQYGVRHLVGKQLVVVTLQYRLGSLGFLSAGTTELPGNAALWDMALAVQWVRNYIGFFGGNPYKIVVMGHGTGASSAQLVALSNIAKGQTSGVVAMSGTAVSHWAMDDSPSNTAKELAELNGCPTGSVLTMIKCLQSVNADSIIRSDSQIEFERLSQRGFETSLSGRLGAAPVNEGRHDGRSLPSLIQKSPMEELEKDELPKIPLLTGTTRDETKKAVQGQFKNEIVNKLKNIPGFLDKVLVSKLQGLIGIHKEESSGSNRSSKASAFSLLDPLQFTNYLQIPQGDLQAGLSKISEVTSDALFNVPAFVTADYWSKKAGPTFMYRFEHFGKLKKGSHFLRGMFLVGNTTEGDLNDTISHGDDLAYLFDPQDIEGNPIQSDTTMTEEDEKVRDVFTQMISDFVRYDKVKLDKKDVQPFSSETSNYVEITSNPKQRKNFRFCELALWCGLAQRLQSSTCTLFNVVNTQIKQVQQGLLTGVNKVGGLANFSNVGNNLHLMSMSQKPNKNSLGSISKPLGGLFG